MTPAGVRLLGPVRVFERDLSTGPSRQQAVFVVLATRIGEPVGSGQLARAVWPQPVADNAAGRIQNDITGLRRMLRLAGLNSRETLVSVADGYELRLDPRQIDVWQFEKLCRRANAAAALGDHPAAAAAFTAALGLWRGEALCGVPGPFAERERAQLAERELAATEGLLRAKTRLGSAVDQTAEVAHLVRLHPDRESLRELLMITLARSGRRAEALLAFQDTRQTLRPGPELRRIHDRILADDGAFTEAS
ncbi:MAG: BTAD domain-containing putative transcriptional regulator [Kibdelosporangium sp.]